MDPPQDQRGGASMIYGQPRKPAVHLAGVSESLKSRSGGRDAGPVLAIPREASC